mgnify:CR=1 FL=1
MKNPKLQQLIEEKEKEFRIWFDSDKEKWDFYTYEDINEAREEIIKIYRQSQIEAWNLAMEEADLIAKIEMLPHPEWTYYPGNLREVGLARQALSQAREKLQALKIKE